MKRFPSLKTYSDFSKVYKKGKSQGNKYLVIYALKTEEENKIGISVSKKVGNSIVRHSIVRKIREIFRLNLPDIKEGYSIVVVARAAAKDATYLQLEDSYIRLIKKLGLAFEENK